MATFRKCIYQIISSNLRLYSNFISMYNKCVTLIFASLLTTFLSCKKDDGPPVTTTSPTTPVVIAAVPDTLYVGETQYAYDNGPQPYASLQDTFNVSQRHDSVAIVRIYHGNNAIYAGIYPDLYAQRNTSGIYGPYSFGIGSGITYRFKGDSLNISYDNWTAGGFHRGAIFHGKRI